MHEHFAIRPGRELDPIAAVRSRVAVRGQADRRARDRDPGEGADDGTRHGCTVRVDQPSLEGWPRSERSAARLCAPAKRALKRVPAAVESGQTLSTQTLRAAQSRFGLPSSARSLAQAASVFGPVAKPDPAVFKDQVPPVLRGQGASDVA